MRCVDAAAAVLADDGEALEAEVPHHLDLVLRHRALRIVRVVGQPLRLAAVAVAAQVGGDDRELLGERAARRRATCTCVSGAPCSSSSGGPLPPLTAWIVTPPLVSMRSGDEARDREQRRRTVPCPRRLRACRVAERVRERRARDERGRGAQQAAALGRGRAWSPVGGARPVIVGLIVEAPRAGRVVPRRRGVRCCCKRSSSAIVSGLRTGGCVARNTPVGPVERRAAFAVRDVEPRAVRGEILDDVVRAAIRGAVNRRDAHRVHGVHVVAELVRELHGCEQRRRALRRRFPRRPS